MEIVVPHPVSSNFSIAPPEIIVQPNDGVSSHNDGTLRRVAQQQWTRRQQEQFRRIDYYYRAILMNL